ncbi:MAG TPA: hypothetical protein GX497_05465 [Bacillus bacterium]|nr:hypothetical protein [Bacillus sp. (in: firmicutes)]
MDKNKIIHDIVMLHLEKTHDFEHVVYDIDDLASKYEDCFESVKFILENFEPNE